MGFELSDDELENVDGGRSMAKRSELKTNMKMAKCKICGADVSVSSSTSSANVVCSGCKLSQLGSVDVMKC